MSVISLYLNLQIWDNIKIGDPSFNKTQFNWLVFIYFLLNYTKPPDFLINKKKKRKKNQINLTTSQIGNITQYHHSYYKSCFILLTFRERQNLLRIFFPSRFAASACIYVYKKRWFFVFSFWLYGNCTKSYELFKWFHINIQMNLIIKTISREQNSYILYSNYFDISFP